MVRTPGGTEVRLVRVHRPVLRVPQLAIHLDAALRSDGLKLDAQQHVVPIWSIGDPDPGGFALFLAKELGVPPGDVLSHDVMTYDLTGGTLAGADEEFVSSARQDDLACSHASVTALCAATARPGARAGAPHISAGRAVRQRGGRQPVGHRRPRRVAGPAAGTQRPRPRRRRDDFLRAVADSLHVSADMAHATHPNYAERHEPGHWVALGGGPVIKISANAFYSTTAPTHAAFLLAAEQAGVPVQYFVNRSGAPSGSTIGPIVAAGLAIPTVDVGNPTLAMHSARELSGTADAAMMIAAMTAFLRPA